MSAVETYLARPLGLDPQEHTSASQPTLAMIDANGRVRARRAITPATEQESPAQRLHAVERFTPISLTAEPIAPVINLFPSHKEDSYDDAAPAPRRYLSIGERQSLISPRWDQLPASVRPQHAGHLRAADAAAGATSRPAFSASPRSINWYHPAVRRAVRAAVVSVAMLLAFVVGVGIANALTPAPASSGQTITVSPGMTLWDIARSVAGPGGDVDHALYQLQQINDLDSVVLPAGAQIELPR